MRSTTAEKINQLITENNTLRSLSLRFGKFGGKIFNYWGRGTSRWKFGKDLSKIFSALVTNKTLTFLNITGNEIGDSCAIELGNALRKNRTLTSLYMGIKFFSNVTINLNDEYEYYENNDFFRR